MAEEAARNALSPNTEACGSNKRAKDCDEADDISLQTTQKRSRKGNENETDEREEAAKEQEEDDKDEKEEEEEEQKKAAKPSALIVTGDSTTNTTAICSTSLATPRPAITRFSFFLEPTLTSGLLGRTMGCFERLKGAVQYHEGRRKLLLGPKLEPESKRLPLDLLIHATHISCALNIIRRDDDGFLHFEGKVPTQYTSDSPLVWFAFCPSEPLKGHELFKSNASSVYGPVVFKFKRAAFDVMTVKHGYKLYKLGTREYGREFCHTYVFSKAPIQLLENFLFDEKNPKPKEKDKRYLISSPKAEQRLPADWGWQWRPAPPQGGYEQTDLAVCCDKEGQLLISYDHLEAIEIRQHTLCIFQGSKRDECQLGTNIARGDHNHNALYSHICGLLPDDQKHKVILC